MRNHKVNLSLNEDIINKVNEEASIAVKNVLDKDLSKMILFGSCARGDYTEDSDIDIAILTNCDREAVKKYNTSLATIAAFLAEKYFAVVNFVSIPAVEFEKKKSWYVFFKNIENEGKCIYG
ncbi:MAG: nucleotidyltransferase domain-containing protein [Clostridiales bacterium]|nr:nucleotidyltransferase domain-containing protein [Clostridiales bacterium]